MEGRRRGGETGGNEARAKETGGKETGGKTTGTKETGTEETEGEEMGGNVTGRKATGGKAPRAPDNQETGRKGYLLLGEKEMDNMLPGEGEKESVGDTDNDAFREITDNLGKILYKGQDITLKAFPLRHLMPSNLTDYYTYEGSLTTPPCSEVVIWNIFRESVAISERQLESFRKLRTCRADEEEAVIERLSVQRLQDNYRPLQPLHGRMVRKSFRVEGTEEPKSTGKRRLTSADRDHQPASQNCEEENHCLIHHRVKRDRRGYTDLTRYTCKRGVQSTEHVNLNVQ
ncbi:hypothetical protein LSAT2_029880 [Lamellibrachia satsuma]|nr:hypothetical protein LSAT2_029880 [Lamellibrachia satsuma]